MAEDYYSPMMPVGMDNHYYSDYDAGWNDGYDMATGDDCCVAAGCVSGDCCVACALPHNDGMDNWDHMYYDDSVAAHDQYEPQAEVVFNWMDAAPVITAEEAEAMEDDMNTDDVHVYYPHIQAEIDEKWLNKLNELDGNGDGKITWDEWWGVARETLKDLAWENVYWFKKFDHDDDNIINEADCDKVCPLAWARCGEKWGDADGNLSLDQFFDNISEAEIKEIKEIFNEYDHDKDGTVNKEEFAAHIEADYYEQMRFSQETRKAAEQAFQDQWFEDHGEYLEDLAQIKEKWALAQNRAFGVKGGKSGKSSAKMH